MTPRIGILTKVLPSLGVWRDAESLMWALAPATASVFPVEYDRRLERAPRLARAGSNYPRAAGVVERGTPLIDWLQRVDTVIVPESLLPGTFELMRSFGIRVVLIPNLDWAVDPCDESADVGEWIGALRSSRVEVWAKTPRIRDTLSNAGIECELLEWSIPDPVLDRPPASNGRQTTYYMNCGRGGWRNRRGVDIALKSFSLVRNKTSDVRLILSTVRPLEQYDPPLAPCDGIDVQTGFFRRGAIESNYASCSAVLYPSRWEGFGLSLLEALHAGCPVIATDGWPMNELAFHGENALLVPAGQLGNTRLAPRWECSETDFAAAMWTLHSNPELRSKLTGASSLKLRNRQSEFVRNVRRLSSRGGTQSRVGEEAFT
jgi:glycosyltransferase involved in cell wall biosynthesis